MPQHFTPEELKKLAEWYADTSVPQEQMGKHLLLTFPCIYDELRRLWEVEKEFIELEKTIVFLDGKESL